MLEDMRRHLLTRRRLTRFQRKDIAAMHKTASTTVPVHPLLAERWSPRGFDRAHELGEDSLTALLEAARWAPSAQNSQPWRFLVARRGDEAHEQLFAALAPGNQAWAGAASALVLVAARTVGDDGRPQPWALYDTGQAVAALITQAQADGLAVHQMGGFDTAAVRAEFGLGETLTPVVVIAVGRRDPIADLPEPLAARETAPRTRHPVSKLLLPEVSAPQLAAA
jgi:nitroreductase